jgi:hypothetical protein
MNERKKVSYLYYRHHPMSLTELTVLFLQLVKLSGLVNDQNDVQKRAGDWRETSAGKRLRLPAGGRARVCRRRKGARSPVGKTTCGRRSGNGVQPLMVRSQLEAATGNTRPVRRFDEDHIARTEASVRSKVQDNATGKFRLL